MKKKLLMVGLLVVLFAFPVYADSVIFLDGTTFETTALTGYQTDGDDMAGMAVTAGLADGTMDEAYWATTGADNGKATGTGWSLEENGDTFGGTWTLRNSFSSALTFLSIWGGTGNTVFDISYTASTAGSENGRTFERTSSNNFEVVALYSNLVALTGYAPVRDLYLTLSLNLGTGLSAPIGTTGAPGTMTFIADTDNLLLSGDIHPTPEPATLLLLGFGLAGLASLRRKL